MLDLLCAVGMGIFLLAGLAVFAFLAALLLSIPVAAVMVLL